MEGAAVTECPVVGCDREADRAIVRRVSQDGNTAPTAPVVIVYVCEEDRDAVQDVLDRKPGAEGGFMWQNGHPPLVWLGPFPRTHPEVAERAKARA